MPERTNCIGILRVAVGLVIGTGVVPGLMLFGALLQLLADDPRYQFSMVSAAWAWLFVFSAGVLLGLPAHVLAKRSGVSLLGAYVLGGGAIGAMIAFSFFLFFPLGFRFFEALGWFATCGVTSAAVFWLIVIRRERKKGPASNILGNRAE